MRCSCLLTVVFSLCCGKDENESESFEKMCVSERDREEDQIKGIPTVSLLNDDILLHGLIRLQYKHN